MVDRGALVVQMAKAFVGSSLMDSSQPSEEVRQRADAALSRVELFLGIEVEQAKEILDRVLEDVS